ncbi:MAG: hypothetical protein AAF682_13895 [Planctomycetota bacterium]
MFATLKKMMKVGMVTAIGVGLAGVAAAVIVGEGRTRAVVHELHSNVIDSIDSAIEDPAALRAQLREMERQYPEKISQVRGDLAELQHEIVELERERAISERVVALVDQDLGAIEMKLAAHAAPASDELSARNPYGDSPSRVEVRAGQLENQRLVYQNRRADAEHTLVYLHLQQDRLVELLAKLENERSEFQSQIAGLSREIDAIARNDRLIQLLEKRNQTIEECSRYEAVSLDQITGRLSMIRSRQEAELDILATTEAATDYEQTARLQIAAEGPLEPLAQPVRDALEGR